MGLAESASSACASRQGAGQNWEDSVSDDDWKLPMMPVPLNEHVALLMWPLDEDSDTEVFWRRTIDCHR